MKYGITIYFLLFFLCTINLKAQQADTLYFSFDDTLAHQYELNNKTGLWKSQLKGNIIEEGRIEKGKREGSWITYTQSTMVHAQYKNGKLNGPFLVTTYFLDTLVYGVYKEGNKNGKWVEYHEPEFSFENAQRMELHIKTVENFAGGKRHGKYMTWYPSGMIRETGIYKNGIKDSVFNTFYENGNLRSAEIISLKDSTVYYYGHNIHNRIITKGKLVNGKKTGKWLEGEFGTAMGNYKRGEKDGSWTFFKNNDTIAIDTVLLYKYPDLVKGKAEGEILQFYDDGKLRLKGRYKNGLKEGDWYEVGFPYTYYEGGYERGLKQGKWIELKKMAYPLTILKGNYVNDKKEGVFEVYVYNYEYKDFLKTGEENYVAGKNTVKEENVPSPPEKKDYHKKYIPYGSNFIYHELKQDDGKKQVSVVYATNNNDQRAITFPYFYKTFNTTKGDWYARGVFTENGRQGLWLYKDSITGKTDFLLHQYGGFPQLVQPSAHLNVPVMEGIQWTKMMFSEGNRYALLFNDLYVLLYDLQQKKQVKKIYFEENMRDNVMYNGRLDHSGKYVFFKGDNYWSIFDLDRMQVHYQVAFADENTENSQAFIIANHLVVVHEFENTLRYSAYDIKAKKEISVNEVQKPVDLNPAFLKTASYLLHIQNKQLIKTDPYSGNTIGTLNLPFSPAKSWQHQVKGNSIFFNNNDSALVADLQQMKIEKIIDLKKLIGKKNSIERVDFSADKKWFYLVYASVKKSSPVYFDIYDYNTLKKINHMLTPPYTTYPQWVEGQLMFMFAGENTFPCTMDPVDLTFENLLEPQVIRVENADFYQDKNRINIPYTKAKYDRLTEAKIFGINLATGQVNTREYDPQNLDWDKFNADAELKMIEDQNNFDNNTYAFNILYQDQHRLTNSSPDIYSSGYTFFNASQKTEAEKYVRLNILNNNEYIFLTTDHYYLSSKKAAEYFGYEKNLALYPFEQFDLKYNRPDIVLERLGYADSSMINAYHKAYLKRLKKMGFAESMLQEDFHLPEINVRTFETLSPVSDTSELNLDIDIKDSRYKLDRINIYLNDVPVYGTAGIDLRTENISAARKKVKLTLAAGQNKIQLSVLNQAGVESYKQTAYITYKPKKERKPDLYLVTIGAGKYQDKRYDLTYADKDATDIKRTFETSTVYGKVNVYNCTNEQVTRENILKLKAELKKAQRDDVVMITVAGHGVLDKDLNYYLATYDMDFNNPLAKGLPYEELESLVDGIVPLKKVIMLDACHSGEVDKEEVEQLATNTSSQENVKFRTAGAGIQKKNLGLRSTSELMGELFADLRKGTGSTVVSSAGGVEYAMESDQWKNGLFTYCLLHGLKDKAADLNQDGKIMLSELQQYLRDEVIKLSNGAQQPTSRIENLSVDFRIW